MYIWVGILNVFVISQILAFANDLYTESRGKRLFPMIGVDSSLGAWLGAEAASQLQLLAAAMPSPPRMAAQAEAALTSTGAFDFIFNSRYLTWIAALPVLLNVVNSTGEFLLGTVVA